MHRNPDIMRSTIHAHVLGDNTIVEAVPGRSIIVLHFHVTASGGPSTITFKSASTPLTGPDGMSLPEDGSSYHAAWSDNGHFSTKSGEPLILNATGNIQGYCSYIIE